MFFAGNDFAPRTRVDGQPVQDYLQGHYIAAMQQVATHLKDLPNVSGFECLNEPSAGWIGVPNLNQFPWPYKLHASPTPFQSILLGAGYPQEVGIYEIGFFGTKLIETRTFNPEKHSIWLPGRECLWKTNGVWDLDSSGTPHLLKPDHFTKVNGRDVDFDRDYLSPFIARYASAIHAVIPNAFIFIETEPSRLPPALDSKDLTHLVSAQHWYDGPATFNKEFQSWLGYDYLNGKIIFGAGCIRRSYDRLMERFKQAARERLGGVPTLIGEIGIPFDLHKKKAFRSGDFGLQVRAMDRSLKVMDDTLLNYTIWNYTADNSNERGDQWNEEDLSIFSRDQQKNPRNINSGGRALEAVVRPYARATAGLPMRMSFDVRTKLFEFEFRHDPRITAATEFFIPTYQYPNGYRVEVSDGTYGIDQPRQKLSYHHTSGQEIHKIIVRKI